MSDSLRDQLLKSGVAQKFKAQAKPARESTPQSVKPHKQYKPAHKPAHPAGKPAHPHAPKTQGSADVDLARAYALRAKHEKEERERVQRETERLAREKKERKQKLAALLETKALNAPDADVARHFPHGNKIRRVYCTPEQLAQLNRGELAVVQLAGRYLIVDRDIALQAQAISEEALVLLCDPNAVAEDDVPPDLVW